ncbi:hypothetical protein Q8G13_27995, partial [Klebsiella pneumoniae]|uniref:hypothetical protein n=1 Tax=Klebsiella pneumoniae TaxID=573 RepID=UPI00272FF890
MRYVKESKWTVNDLTKENNIKRIYNGLKAYIDNILIDASANEGEYGNISDKAYEDLVKIYDNFELFANQHKTYNNLINNKDLE